MRRAFTLLDLLISLLIITILISLLVPALAPALAATRSVSCRSNLRQIHLGLLIYLNEFRSFPFPDETLLAYDPRIFLAGPPTITHCPADRPITTVPSYITPFFPDLYPYSSVTPTPPAPLPPVLLTRDTFARHPARSYNLLFADGSLSTSPTLPRR